MLKSLGVLIAGVFVGAVGVEIVRKKYPVALDKFYRSVHEITSEAKEAFTKGYRNATQSREAAEAGV